MTIQELEQNVWKLDGVRIVVRDKQNTKIGKYVYRRAAQENWSVTEFLKNRINPLIEEREVSVVNGAGEEVHGRTLLKTIRTSYKR